MCVIMQSHVLKRRSPVVKFDLTLGRKSLAHRRPLPLIFEYRTLLFDEEGASMVEYAIVVALIAAVCTVLISSLGRRVSAAFSTVNARGFR